MRKRHADQSATVPGLLGGRLLFERAVVAMGLVALPLSATIVIAPAADAAYAGNNGPIAFVSTRLSEGSFGGIFNVNSQASGLGNANGDQAATTGVTNGDNGAGTDAASTEGPKRSGKLRREFMICVRMKPGHSTDTPIPRGASSRRRPSDSATTPYLVTL